MFYLFYLINLFYFIDCLYPFQREKKTYNQNIVQMEVEYHLNIKRELIPLPYFCFYQIYHKKKKKHKKKVRK